MLFRTILLLIAFVAMIGEPRTVQAAESSDSCSGFITSLPTTIRTPGIWCLKQNLSTAATGGNAITINSNDVTIDCNGFNLNGLAAGVATKQRGIRAINRLNVTVRHCGVRGFQFGVFFDGTSTGSHTVEDNRFDSNTFAALWVEGDGSVLQRNVVLDTGGSTISAAAQGIHAGGSVDLVENTVSGVMGREGGAGSSYGIYTSRNANGSIMGNRVRGIIKGGTGLSRGIYNNESGRITLSSNDVVGNSESGSLGIYCATSEARAKNNVIAGFASPMENCGNAGGNDFEW